MTRLHKNLALNKKEWSKLLIKVKKLLNSELNHIRHFSDESWALLATVVCDRMLIGRFFAKALFLTNSGAMPDKNIAIDTILHPLESQVNAAIQFMIEGM